MSHELSLIRRAYLTLVSKRKNIVVVTRTEADFLAAIGQRAALSELIGTLQRELPQLQANVTEASRALAVAESRLHDVNVKLETARRDLSALLGKSNQNFLTGSQTKCLTEHN
jgi:hypothetical protein